MPACWCAYLRAGEVERRETRLSEIAGPRYIKREDFKAYAASLRYVERPASADLASKSD